MDIGLSRYFLIMDRSETLRRAPRVLLGLVLFGIGIALMVAADLGLGPWDVFHKAVSDLTGINIGRILILTSLAVMVGFVALGERMGLGTVLNTFVIGLTLDRFLPLLGTPSAMWWRIVLMVSGPIVIAIGSGFYIGAGLGPGPRDGLMTGLARRGISVGKARTVIEVVVLAVGLILGGSFGIGTLWFTLGIGPMVAFSLPRMRMR